MLITLEGPEGSGKTTQARLLADWLRARGHDVVLAREPGGTPIGDQIRAVLHDPANTDMAPWAEVFLYAASRAQLVSAVIRPALKAGKVVLCDRYADSTLAYQGYGRGLDLEALRQVIALATGGLTPDLTLYLDIAPEVGLARRRAGGGEFNRLDQETLEFHRRVRAGYLDLASQEPQRWVVVDASGSVEEVQETLRWILVQRIPAL
ncbi:MAG: dTMP kinase [Anaerolineae bacterium]|nr:dTMP kinase [Anaerolineae bacterium]MDW7991393.1 dTMP kinase [Anaerolineae bacterium]